jgi:uncharacterized protein (TIGR04255 family)
MSPQPYKRPPITEAVIALTLTTPAASTEIDKLRSAFRDLYPYEQLVRNVNVELALPAVAQASPTAAIHDEIGYRLSSLDITQLLILWPMTFVISQLAPYPGWDEFFGRFVRDWTIWKKVMNFRPIARIGVRYINRIDIPVSGPVVEQNEYISVYPHLPEALGPTSSYALQAQLPIADMENCKLLLNSAWVPSPLLNHVSFVIDIDIVSEIDPPQRNDAIYDLLKKIRVKKNTIFEMCVTDSARELFAK